MDKGQLVKLLILAMPVPKKSGACSQDLVSAYLGISSGLTKLESFKIQPGSSLNKKATLAASVHFLGFIDSIEHVAKKYGSINCDADIMVQGNAHSAALNLRILEVTLEQAEKIQNALINTN